MDIQEIYISNGGHFVFVNKKIPRVTKWHQLDSSYRHAEVPETPKWTPMQRPVLCCRINFVKKIKNQKKS